MTPRTAAALDWCTACWMASATSPWTPRPVRGGARPKGRSRGETRGVAKGAVPEGGGRKSLSVPANSAEVRTEDTEASFWLQETAEREGDQAGRENDRGAEKK